MSSFSPTYVDSDDYSRMIADLSATLAPPVPTRVDRTQTSNTVVTQPEPTQSQIGDTDTSDIYARAHESDFSVLAKALLPKGTDEKTLDLELAPPDLVQGTFDEDGKCTSAQFVGGWNSETCERVKDIASRYSKLATESATQVNCDDQSERYRGRSARVLKVNEFVKRCHAQTDMSVEQLEGKIKSNLQSLAVSKVFDSRDYEKQYNALGNKNRGTELMRAEMGCLFSNLSLALEEERQTEEYDKETKDLERQKRKLEKKIKKMQDSLKTEGSHQ